MRMLCTVVLGCGILVAGMASAQETAAAKKLIVGKWESVQKVGDKDVKILLEFTANGKVSVTVRAFKADGTYTFPDDKTIETELTFEGERRKVKSEVTVTADALELKDPKSGSSKFKRAN